MARCSADEEPVVLPGLASPRVTQASVGVVGFLALAVEPVFQPLFSKLFSPLLFAFRLFNAEQLYLQDNVRLLLVISAARP